MTLTSPAAAVTITEMVVPATLDADDAADFHAAVALHNAVGRNDSGIDGAFEHTAEEALPQWQNSSDETNRTFLATQEGVLIGAARLGYATAEPTSAEIDLMVLPEHWELAAQPLYEIAENEVRALGRKVVQAWTLHRATPGADPVQPTTGWGEVSNTRHAQLLAKNGFVLEQVERNSVFDLTGDLAEVERLLADATRAAGADYRLIEWTVPTPGQWQASYAWALSRMSTDVPAGGLDVDEEVWDAERVARREARIVEGGQTMSVTAVEHVPSGRIAAFNELVIGADRTGVTHQFCTLVLKEHRGHRLGTLVKTANILRWRTIAPESPRISTANAEENRPMLDINDALGFTPASYFGAWQKRLG